MLLVMTCFKAASGLAIIPWASIMSTVLFLSRTIAATDEYQQCRAGILWIATLHDSLLTPANDSKKINVDVVLFVLQEPRVVRSYNVAKTGEPHSPDSVLDIRAASKRRRTQQETKMLEALRETIEAECSQV